MDLYWSIYDIVGEHQTDVYEDLEDDVFLATVRNNLLTLSFLGGLRYNVSCKSQTEHGLQISVTALTISMHLLDIRIIAMGTEIHSIETK